MLINKTAIKKDKLTIDQIKKGAYFVNNDINDCDILLILDSDHNLRMLNTDNFVTINNQEILKFLNNNYYYEIDAYINRG